MYLVPIGGQPGYVLFSVSPRGRLAIGLTESGLVRLLAPAGAPGEWRLLHEWPADTYSATDLLATLAKAAEPERAEEILELLPAAARERRGEPR